ncbi:unnamed protein product, partial [Notodromas monacha]
MESLRLRWTEYELNWNQVLADAYYERELTDVLVVCEHGEGIMCHGVVLSACSVLLHELLEETTAECSVVVLDGVRGSHFDVLLKYMYFGEVLVPEGDLEQVLDLACQLRVKGLMEFRASALLGTFHSCEKPESEELRGALSDEVFATSADLFAEEAKFSSRYSELSSAPSSGHNDSLLAAVPATTGCSSLADDNSSLSDEPQLPLFSEPMNNTFLVRGKILIWPTSVRPRDADGRNW